MSRPLRIEYANAYYHVMNRGAGRQNIFNNEQERILFLDIISDAYRQYNIEIHAYCLMSNHYHLLVKTPAGNLSRAMRHINGVYTQRYNRMNSTDGPLFRGRYKSILVDSDAYLLHLSKYIHLNPLEANMVDDLSNYKWSSYPSYIGDSSPPPWLIQSEIYAQLTYNCDEGLAYQLFMIDKPLDEQVVNFYGKNRYPPVIGTESFINQLQIPTQTEEIPRVDKLIQRPSIEQIIKTTADEFYVSTESILKPRKGGKIKNNPRKVVMYIAQKIWDYRLKEIMSSLNLKHYGTAGNAIFMIANELNKNPELNLKINTIIKRLDP